MPDEFDAEVRKRGKVVKPLNRPVSTDEEVINHSYANEEMFFFFEEVTCPTFTTVHDIPRVSEPHTKPGINPEFSDSDPTRPKFYPTHVESKDQLQSSSERSDSSIDEGPLLIDLPVDETISFAENQNLLTESVPADEHPGTENEENPVQEAS